MVEPLTLAFAALNFTGALVAQQIAGEAVEEVWERLKASARKRFGRDPIPIDVGPTSELADELDPALIKSAEALFSSDPTLRRVRLVAPVFNNARILWVDDTPKGNTYEAGFLRSLGSSVEQVFTTDEAVARVNEESYHLVISDMHRGDDPEAGLKLLTQIQGRVPLVFYVMHVDSGRDRPRSSLGVVSRPDELFHIVMDALERTRA